MEAQFCKWGAAALMEWLGLHAPDAQRVARSFTSPGLFHEYMRKITGISRQDFDSHNHACEEYLLALTAKPAASLGALLRQAQERGNVKPAAAPTTERTRPALTWATPKPTDRFEGFTSTYDTGAQLADDNSHPLQRMTDPSDPLHGSAFLR